MTRQSGRILVIRGGAIGDFILTLPVLAALRTHLPQTCLTVLGYPHIAALALAGGLADEVQPIEARGLAAFFNAHAEPPPDLATFFAGFAIIVSYLYDPDGVFQRNVRRCTNAVFIQGPHRPDDTGTIHASEMFLGPLKQLAIFEADPVPQLRLSASRAPGRVAPPTPTQLRLLALHPGSGSERKNWPEVRWAALLERLAARTDLRLLLIGGEAEGDRLERLSGRWPAERLELARSLPLVQLASRLSTCDVFAGHDSGITHLAAALGRPGIVLWGATNAAVWRPRSEGIRLLRGPSGLDSIEVAEVEAALTDLLARTESP